MLGIFTTDAYARGCARGAKGGGGGGCVWLIQPCDAST